MTTQNKQLLVNKMQCPDGTILQSKFKYDYQEYKQKNGEKYSISGGLDHTRFAGVQLDKIISLALYYGDDHKLLRDNFCWKSQEGVWILLKEISDDNLDMLVLDEGEYNPPEVLLLFKDEREYRNDEL